MQDWHIIYDPYLVKKKIFEIQSRLWVIRQFWKIVSIELSAKPISIFHGWYETASKQFTCKQYQQPFCQQLPVSPSQLVLFI